MAAAACPCSLDREERWRTSLQCHFFVVVLFVCVIVVADLKARKGFVVHASLASIVVNHPDSLLSERSLCCKHFFENSILFLLTPSLKGTKACEWKPVLTCQSPANTRLWRERDACWISVVWVTAAGKCQRRVENESLSSWIPLLTFILLNRSSSSGNV